MTGDKVLDLVHLFLLKKLLCICTVGFCGQVSSWSSSCGWIEEKFVQDCYEVVGFLAPGFQFSGL